MAEGDVKEGRNAKKRRERRIKREMGKARRKNVQAGENNKEIQERREGGSKKEETKNKLRRERERNKW